MSLKQQLIKDKLPKHVAVIMDGNGRWAKKKGNIRIFGHKNGVKAVRETVEAAAEMQIEYLTLYAFSTENWKRPKMEVNALMSLLINSIHNELETLNKNNIRLFAIGNINQLPAKVQKELYQAIENTSGNTGLTLVLALSYSGRWEILNAVNQLLNDVKNGKIEGDEIDSSLFNDYLATAKIPDPELLIRTSGEFRISNFLLWQIAYSELYFTETLWPDFRKEDFFKALLDFQNRERRFGMTSEQL
ncbi:MAG: isoprenyl transferase [Bacteroidales bacterium]|nr:isoprenyl transferase [Bacteroidales bacterium]